MKWENADKYHRNDNYNSAILEWEAEAMNSHGLMHGRDHNFNYGVGHNPFFPSRSHCWSVCRWFAGDVSEAVVFPTYPAASLDRPSLEDVL